MYYFALVLACLYGRCMYFPLDFNLYRHLLPKISCVLVSYTYYVLEIIKKKKKYIYIYTHTHITVPRPYPYPYPTFWIFAVPRTRTHTHTHTHTVPVLVLHRSKLIFNHSFLFITHIWEHIKIAKQQKRYEKEYLSNIELNETYLRSFIGITPFRGYFTNCEFLFLCYG